MRIVLDANVLVSGLQWTGNERRALWVCLADDHVLLTSRTLLWEVERVLTSKFDRPRADVLEFIAFLKARGILVEAAERIIAVHDDPDDDHVLECAVAGEADLIVTGDKHLLRLGSFRGIRIIRAADLVGRY